MKSAHLVLAISVLAGAIGCSGSDQLPVVSDPTVKVDSTPKPALELVDLSKVPPLAPKGRFQDGRIGNGQPNQIAKDIVANGKDSIPFLIQKLDDETEIDRHIINYWYRLSEGDLALVILFDLFTDKTEANSTIPGFSYGEFLEGGNDPSLTGEEILRRYIQKHGRARIEQRWQRLWDEKKDKIFWDERCYCFRLGT
jgi:hypothetical protein